MSGAYHSSRFVHDPRRDMLWRALWRYHFSRRIRPDHRVLELGAGYGHFINNVVARRRIAIDQWDGFVGYLDPGVEGVVGNIEELDFLDDGSVDFVLASNVFEHISQDTLARVLTRLRRVLAPGGTLNILQPNYRYAFKEYFDDYTHVAIYSHVSMADFLTAHDWRVLETRPRFLPLTIKSRLPIWPPLIRAYLLSPIKPLGKQMFLSAAPRR